MASQIRRGRQQRFQNLLLNLPRTAIYSQMEKMLTGAEVGAGTMSPAITMTVPPSTGHRSSASMGISL